MRLRRKAGVFIILSTLALWLVPKNHPGINELVESAAYAIVSTSWIITVSWCLVSRTAFLELISDWSGDKNETR